MRFLLLLLILCRKIFAQNFPGLSALSSQQQLAAFFDPSKFTPRDLMYMQLLYEAAISSSGSTPQELAAAVEQSQGSPRSSGGNRGPIPGFQPIGSSDVKAQVPDFSGFQPPTGSQVPDFSGLQPSRGFSSGGQPQFPAGTSVLQPSRSVPFGSQAQIPGLSGLQPSRSVPSGGQAQIPGLSGLQPSRGNQGGLAPIRVPNSGQSLSRLSISDLPTPPPLPGEVRGGIPSGSEAPIDPFGPGDGTPPDPFAPGVGTDGLNPFDQIATRPPNRFGSPRNEFDRIPTIRPDTGAIGDFNYFSGQRPQPPQIPNRPVLPRWRGRQNGEDARSLRRRPTLNRHRSTGVGTGGAQLDRNKPVLIRHLGQIRRTGKK